MKKNFNLKNGKRKLKIHYFMCMEKLERYKTQLLYLYVIALTVPAQAAAKGPVDWINNITGIFDALIDMLGSMSVVAGVVLLMGGILAIRRGTKEQGTQQGVMYVGGVVGCLTGVVMLYMNSFTEGSGSGILGEGAKAGAFKRTTNI